MEKCPFCGSPEIPGYDRRYTCQTDGLDQSEECKDRQIANLQQQLANEKQAADILGERTASLLNERDNLKQQLAEARERLEAWRESGILFRHVKGRWMSDHDLEIYRKLRDLGEID